MAGDMIAEMPGQQPCVEVIAAADAVADLQIDRLARIELRGTLRLAPGTAGAANAAKAAIKAATTVPRRPIVNVALTVIALPPPFEITAILACPIRATNVAADRCDIAPLAEIS
jgi:hypothetical protein